MLIPLRDVHPRPLRRVPVATIVLAAANVVVFLFAWLLDEAARQQLVLRAAAIPLEVTRLADIAPANLVPPPFTIISSMFMHGSVMHIVGNMWFLWLFGDNVEERMGRLRFVVFYLLTGVIGALAQCFAMPNSTVPMIGASGAVAGVLGGYVLAFPRARIVTLLAIPLFFHTIELPAWIFLGLWFAGQFLISANSGIAWMAHVGGFLGGLGLIRLFTPARTSRSAVSDEIEVLPPDWRSR